MTRSGFWQEAAMEAIDKEDVLDAKMVSGETQFSNSENNFRLISIFSIMASMTKSECDNSPNVCA
jgi:hypothetical protein